MNLIILRSLICDPRPTCGIFRARWELKRRWPHRLGTPSDLLFSCIFVHTFLIRHSTCRTIIFQLAIFILVYFFLFFPIFSLARNILLANNNFLHVFESCLLCIFRIPFFRFLLHDFTVDPYTTTVWTIKHHTLSSLAHVIRIVLWIPATS